MRWWGIVIALMAVMQSCTAPRTTEMTAVNPHEWSKPCDVLIENEDTLSLNRIGIAVRYNNSFKVDTLTLQVQVSTPDLCSFEETVTLQLERPYTASAVASSEMRPYRKHSLLKQRGFYIFTLTPKYPVQGIEAVGITIEKE